LATRETVAIDTPASSATCRMVTRPGRGSESLSSTLGIEACPCNLSSGVGGDEWAAGAARDQPGRG
jgi:hypothetical protein